MTTANLLFILNICPRFCSSLNALAFGELCKASEKNIKTKVRPVKS